MVMPGLGACGCEGVAEGDAGAVVAHLAVGGCGGLPVGAFAGVLAAFLVVACAVCRQVRELGSGEFDPLVLEEGVDVVDGVDVRGSEDSAFVGITSEDCWDFDEFALS